MSESRFPELLLFFIFQWQQVKRSIETHTGEMDWVVSRPVGRQKNEPLLWPRIPSGNFYNIQKQENKEQKCLYPKKVFMFSSIGLGAVVAMQKEKAVKPAERRKPQNQTNQICTAVKHASSFHPSIYSLQRLGVFPPTRRSDPNLV